MPTSVLEILRRAGRQCSIAEPSSWLTATDQTVLEMLDFLDRTARDIRDRLEIVGPMSKSATITGTGAENYDLPEDFYRLHRSTYSVYERLRTRRACVPVTDDGEWEYLQELGTTGAYRFYRLLGYDGAWQIGFQRPLETGLEVVVSYVTENWLTNAGTQKATFDDAGDECLLPRDLVEAGIVWRFRRRKALEYADVRQEYEVLLARYGNDSRTRRRINFGRPNMRGPFDVPVPDVIPDA